MKKLQCRHDRFPIFAAPPISDRSRELTNSKKRLLAQTHSRGRAMLAPITEIRLPPCLGVCF